MSNDTKRCHSFDHHRLSKVHPVFMLNTVFDDFPLNFDLSLKEKNIPYLQGAHYSGPSIFKTLLKAAVERASQYSSGIRDFFPPKGKACLCRKHISLESWCESVKSAPWGMKNHHKSSTLSQSIHL